MTFSSSSSGLHESSKMRFQFDRNWLQILLTKFQFAKRSARLGWETDFRDTFPRGRRRKRRTLVNHLNWKPRIDQTWRSEIVLEGKCGRFVKMLLQHEWSATRNILGYWFAALASLRFHASNLIIVIDSVRCGFYRTLKAVVNGYNQSI